MAETQQSSVLECLADIANELDRLADKDSGNENEDALWRQFVGMNPAQSDVPVMPRAPGPAIALP
jgi:hypothetical protein